MAVVYVDESGHTGPNLLCRDQPFLVLASVKLPERVIRERIELLAVSTKSPEPKFAKLMKTRAGQQALLDLASFMTLQRDGRILEVVHKRFALSTKLLSGVVEPHWYHQGRQFHQDGEHVVLANTLYNEASAHAPADYDEFLTLGVKLYNEGPKAAAPAMAQVAKRLAKVNERLAPVAQMFIDALAWRERAGWKGLRRDQLELQAGSLVSMTFSWNSVSPVTLTYCIDESKELRASAPNLMELARPDGPVFDGWAAGRAMSLPLRVQRVIFRDSANTPGIQLADCLAGMMNHVLVAKQVRDRRIPDFSAPLERIIGDWDRIGWMVPHADRTPEETGRVGFDGDGFVRTATERMYGSRDNAP